MKLEQAVKCAGDKFIRRFHWSPDWAFRAQSIRLKCKNRPAYHITAANGQLVGLHPYEIEADDWVILD